MILHNKVITTLEDIEAVERVIRSGHLSQGPEVEALEADFCAYTGRKYAVAVASGTAALRIALLCRRGLKPTVPAYSCVALANAALSLSDGLDIVDIETDRWTFDIDDLKEPARAAAIVVNTFGLKARLPKCVGLVIEDCTHGFGEHRSDIEVLSFHATKLIGGAAGGIILTDNKDYATTAADRRDYDDQPASGTRLNDKMSDVHAALVRAKMHRLPALLAEREELACEYLERLRPLADMGLVGLPFVQPGRTWYRFVIRVRDSLRVAEHLFRKGVIAHRPVELWASEAERYPIANHAYSSLVSLPLYPGLTKRDVRRVCEALGEVLS